MGSKMNRLPVWVTMGCHTRRWRDSDFEELLKVFCAADVNLTWKVLPICVADMSAPITFLLTKFDMKYIIS